jgi:hypothetical protein
MTRAVTLSAFFLWTVFAVVAGLACGDGESPSAAPRSSQAPSPTPTPAPESPTVAPSPTAVATLGPDALPADVLLGLQAALNVKAPIRDASWNVRDDQSELIPYAGVGFDLGMKATRNVGAWGAFTDAKQVTAASLGPLVSATGRYFAGQGFSRREADPADVTDIYSIFDGGIVAIYESGIRMCLLTTHPGFDGFASIYCGHIDEPQRNLRREFAPAVNPNNSRVVVDVIKVVGNYAIVGVSARGGGAVSYLVKLDGVWTRVWGGQNNIECKVARQYEFPDDFECGDYPPTPTPVAATTAPSAEDLRALRALGNPNNHAEIEVSVGTFTGNHAIASAGARQAGTTFYAVKQDGVWTKVWSGQDFFPCDVAKQYGFPAEFECR